MIIQLKPVELPKDLSEWSHPDLELIDPLAQNNEEDRSYTDEEWKQLQDNGGINIQVETRDLIEIGAELKSKGLPAMGFDNGWKPKPPTDNHFLIAVYSDEDGYVYLWWAEQRKELV